MYGCKFLVVRKQSHIYEELGGKKMIGKSNLKKEQKQDENKVSVIMFNTNMGRSFFVRFYTDDIKEEFFKIIDSLKQRNRDLCLKEKDGTYQVIELGKTTYESNLSIWDILMHKYMSLSKQTRKDSQTGQKFYPIRFSHEYIEPCGRKLVNW